LRTIEKGVTRAVFDVVGFLRGLIYPGSRWGRIVFDHRGDYELIISPPLVREFLGTASRQRVNRKFGAILGRNLKTVLGIIERATVVQITDEIQTPYLRDPKENHVLATAVADDADYIVTEDKDLLVLGTHRGIVICDAASFLEVIGCGEHTR